MIKSIIYPTGGRTNFNYESNFYYKRDVGKEACGGLRIKSIENMAVDGKSEFKTYKYNRNVMVMVACLIIYSHHDVFI